MARVDPILSSCYIIIDDRVGKTADSFLQLLINYLLCSLFFVLCSLFFVLGGLYRIKVDRLSLNSKNTS